MYVPPQFSVTDLPTLHDAIVRYSFATLVSQSPVGLEASHLPLLLERDHGSQGSADRSHGACQPVNGRRQLGRKCWPSFRVRTRIFRRSGTRRKVVPTWNYVAVHAYGRLELIADEAEVEVAASANDRRL